VDARTVAGTIAGLAAATWRDPLKLRTGRVCTSEEWISDGLADFGRTAVWRNSTESCVGRASGWSGLCGAESMGLESRASHTCTCHCVGVHAWSGQMFQQSVSGVVVGV
jgi:hypothetical protein